VFDVDPGHQAGGQTTLTVRYYHTPAATTADPFPAPQLYDQFTAYRDRSDGLHRPQTTEAGAVAS
jgi:hypothetical protein